MNGSVSTSCAIAFQTGVMTGLGVGQSMKRLRDLRGLFRDDAAAGAADQETVVYRVQYWMPVEEGTEGGLFWGTTVIEPGRIGDEYFMTHGHRHLADRAEFYATIDGQGALILMDAAGRTWFEPMQPGSLHYIAGRLAHRVANIGSRPLVFTACWPSDAGHDYASIRERGFGACLREVDGKPMLTPEAPDARARG